MSTAMKLCHHCNRLKPTTEFHKDNSREDGLHYICKECVSEKAVCDMDCFNCRFKDCINCNPFMTEWEKEAIRNWG